MSRKLVWFYNLLFLGFFAGVLFVTNPALAAAPVGFSAVFLVALFILQFIDWALSKVITAHKWVVGVPAVIGLFFLFTGLATVAWGLFAALLTVGSFAAQRPRKVKPTPVEHNPTYSGGSGGSYYQVTIQGGGGAGGGGGTLDIPAAARRVA